MGLFDDLFGNDKKKSQQAFGLFSFMNEQEKEENTEIYEEQNSKFIGLAFININDYSS